MADDVHYASGADATTNTPPTNKRKYDDEPAPSPSGTRRPTGFSAPISSSPPDPSRAPPPYNSVPPPADEIQLAKQKAQEIAARLFNSADPKRPRVENGGGFDSGSIPDQKPLFASSQVGSAPSAIPISYGFQSTSKTINIPNGRVGVIIGKGGETIKYLQEQSGAKIQVTRDMDADPNSPTRLVELMGNSEQIAKAEQLIMDVLNEAETGGSGTVTRRFTGQSGTDQFVMKVPNNKVGLIIGKGGETIKTMQSKSGARVQVIPLHLPPGDTSTERTVQIDGTSAQIESAKQLVNEVISENRLRSSSMTGGYTQQGYQARPQANWANPTPPSMQQPGYAYVQPGAYPGPSPQYNVSQSTYAGYPPQQQPGGYSSSGWDQTATVPPSQQTTPGSGYDYYGQPAPQQQQQVHNGTAAADNPGYNYNQPPASGYLQGQGYPQDSYSGGYQTTAPQPGCGQSNPVPGYDQQQAYNAASGYGNMTTPTRDENVQAPPPATGQQVYNTSQQQPSPNPSGYPSQGAAYGMPPTSQAGYGNQPPAQPGYGPGYGLPQVQKPPTSQPSYGQTHQSPSAQGSYAQTGYPPAPTGYAQPDSAAPRAQSGYGAPSYGAPPVSQQPYGQPPPYNGSSYGSGYSQPPVYSADGNAGAASQVAPQGTVARASPQS